MPPRQRTKSPRNTPVISGNQLSGTPGTESEKARDAAVLSSNFETAPFEDSDAPPQDRTATPKATFVGEQLEFKDRETRIAEAAYWRAQERGFAPGYELEDWLAAEKEIDALLGSEGAQRAP